MQIKIEAYEGIVLTDPVIDLINTIDDPKNETFSPMILLIDGVNSAIRLGHLMPPQPYINGTWTDDDVQNTIDEYIKTIEFL